MVCFRIIHKKYTDPLFAPGVAGRWNIAGQKVLYCSDSIALAFLESMIRRQGIGFNDDFRIAHIKIPDNITPQIITEKELQKGWNNPFDYSKTQSVSNSWYNNLESLLLIVPSAVLSEGNNLVINVTHPDFSIVKLIKLTPLIPDQRLEEILKNVKFP